VRFEVKALDMDMSVSFEKTFHQILPNAHVVYVATRFAQARIDRTWMIKEAFLIFWNYVTDCCARRDFTRWYFWETHS
jgi:hypothetical protein